MPERQTGQIPGGTSGTPPGAILRDAFHFLAEPAPQCCSNWVQENSRLASGLVEHSLHWQMTRCRLNSSSPLMLLQKTGICRAP